MPVALAGGDEDHVAHDDALGLLAFHLNDPLALDDDEHLIEGMRMVAIHRTILEGDDANPDLLALVFADKILALHRANEQIAGRRNPGFRANVLDLQRLLRR